MISMGVGVMSSLVAVFVALVLPVFAVYAIIKIVQAVFFVLSFLVRGIGKLGGRIGGFGKGIVVDVLHFAGSLLTAGVILPLALVNFIIGRWSAARHYGRACEDELTSALLSLYRVGISRPLHFLGLNALTDGFERRLPDVVARVPRADGPRTLRNKKRQFDGYKVVGTLPTGGSGARLYLARPDATKVAHFATKGHGNPGQVVIKSFALEEGSTLPQIVRESRALESANKLGLVLDHDLSKTSFHYVMPYVPGDDLDTVTRRLHARSGPAGLGTVALAHVLGYASDLLATLDRFHAGGLWHKDIKPRNVIVSGDRAHLVDLGLVTPLQSAMTLTTHGTEYYRDPEMVRQAMKGVRVHEVDGVKFDVYSAGAVLFSMIENSFPGQGSLSRISKECPETVQWIIRRAMSEMNTRYGSAREMLADLEAVMAASDPFALRPADLPSVVSGGVTVAATTVPPTFPKTTFVDSDPLDQTPADAGQADSSTAVPARGQRRRTRRKIVGTAALAIVSAATVGTVVAVNANEINARKAEDIVARLGVEPFASRAEVRRRASNERRRRAREERRFESIWEDRLGPLFPPVEASAEADGTASELALEAGRVLILEDLPAQTEDTQILDTLETMLSSHGYAVYGTGNGDDLDSEIRYAAGARNAVGLYELSDGEGLKRLQTFVDETPDLDAVLWLALGEDPERLLFQVIVSDAVQDPSEIALQRAY